MENKKEKRKVSTKTLIAALLVLVLLLASVLGFTLARYITQGDPGSAGVGIARWDVKDNSASAGQFTFEKLSPYKGENGTDGDTPRSNTITTENPILSITNSGDVAAEVKLVVTTQAYAYDFEGNLINLDALTDRIDGTYENAYAPWQETFNDIFTVTFTVTAGTAEVSTWTDTTAGTNTYTVTIPAKTGDAQALEVTAAVTWTSDTEDAGGYTADLRDTWIGEHVGSVRWNYTWEAVQGSQIPAEQP